MEAHILRRLHGSAQHTQITSQRVDVGDVEIFFRRAAEHPEPGATRGHELTDDERVGSAFVEVLAVHPDAADAFPGLLAAVVPHFHTCHVTVRQMIPSRNALLQGLLQHLTFDGEAQQGVLERLHLIDLAECYGALGKIGANAAVIHDRHVRAAGGALRVRDEPPETVFVTFTLERDLEPRDDPLGDVANRLLLTPEGLGHRDVRLDLVRVRPDGRGPHFPPAGDAHEVYDADRTATRLRLLDRDAVDHRVHTHVRVTRDDQIDRPGIDLASDVQNLAVAGSG